MNTTVSARTENKLEGTSQEEPSSLFKTRFHQDRLNYRLLQTIAVVIITALCALILLLIHSAWPVIQENNIFKLITSSMWNPIEEEFGMLPFIYGTVVTSLIALILSGPTSVAIALFINEILPKKLGKFIGFLIEMIAAVPSIVFGLWGLSFLVPWVKEALTPILKEYLGFLPIFQGPSFGIGLLTASFILAIMITPTITSICREVFKTVPRLQKESALALGATRFEMIKLAILKPSFSGIMGGFVLGLGRALGETMAVAMVIGNNPHINFSLFSPSATMASVIANEYAEADSDMHLAALCFVGVVLFSVTLTINSIARVIVWKFKKTHPRKKR